MSDQITVAIDAMGGDHAPSAPVKGAVLAARNTQTKILLVGDQGPVEAELEKHDTEGLPISVIGSEGKIEDSEAPALALRQKPRSSVLVATGLVKAGTADAVISMGSTGGSMAAAVVILGTIKGIERPAIGGPIVGSAPNQTIVDLGSNIDCKPSQLLGFGILGSVFSKILLNIDDPKIGVLSVGSEQSKGNSLTKEASSLFSKSGLNFIGNVEGNDLVKGTADVVVCDGFVGNIALKTGEGVAGLLIELLEQAFTRSMYGRFVGLLARPIIGRLLQLMDPSRHNGASLLGLQGVVIKSHGNANERAMLAAIRQAVREVQLEVPRRINERLDDLML